MKLDLYAPPGRERVRQTRPGTPMIGPYSVNEMDDFYRALSAGVVKPTGVMNYVQRLYITERCPPGAAVVDVCCGRGLQLPVLYRYAPHIVSYTGLDISPAHLAEARDQVRSLDQLYGSRPFTVTFAECDVSQTWPAVATATVIIYTSALEHMPRANGAASLKQAAAALAQDGVLYLSTPNTHGDPPRLLQHGVHVYEWNDAELQPVLADAGLVIEDTVGLLPPSGEVTASVLADRYGEAAVAWYRRLTETVPASFLGVVSAAALGGAALELLYVCRRGQ